MDARPENESPLPSLFPLIFQLLFFFLFDFWITSSKDNETLYTIKYFLNILIIPAILIISIKDIADRTIPKLILVPIYLINIIELFIYGITIWNIIKILYLIINFIRIDMKKDIIYLNYIYFLF